MKAPLLASFTLLIGILLTGCETLQPATVTSNQIINRSVGFNGYELAIPEGYQVYPGSEFNSSIAEHPLVKFWETKKNYYTAGNTIDEYFYFIGEKKAFVFVVGHINWSFAFSDVPPDRIEAMLGSILNSDFPSKMYCHNYMPYKKSYMAEVTSRESLGWERTYIGYILLGSLKEFYQFIGFAEQNNLDVLQRDMKQTINSLDF